MSGHCLQHTYNVHALFSLTFTGEAQRAKHCQNGGEHHVPTVPERAVWNEDQTVSIKL